MKAATNDIGELLLNPTCPDSNWYTQVAHEGNFEDPVALLHAFLRRSLRIAAKGAVQEICQQRVEELACGALRDGFSEFKCDIDRGAEGLPISLTHKT
jgi:hypothetical protein